MGATNHTSKVSIVKIQTAPDVEEATEKLGQLFKLLGGFDNIIPQDVKRILIKPNLVFPEKASTGIVTNPILVKSLAMMLLDSGYEVVVGDSSGVGTGPHSLNVFKETGFTEMCDELKIPLVDFKTGDSVKVPIPEGKIIKHHNIAKAAYDCDFYISVSPVKTHCEAVMSLSMKNMKGCVPTDEEKSRMHRINLNDTLVDLFTIMKPHLSILDGTVGLMGLGPGRPGIPMNLGLLIASTEAVAADSTAARICGYDPYEVSYLKKAEERGLGSTKAEDIIIIGEELSDVIYPNFVRPPRNVEEISCYDNIKIYSGGVCSSCVVALAGVLGWWAPKDKLENGKDLCILMGPSAKKPDDDENIIAMGKCLKKYAKNPSVTHIDGCPPPIRDLANLIKNKLGYENEPEWSPPFADE